MGLMPVLDHNQKFVTDKNSVTRKANRFEISRRENQLFHQCVWLTLEKSVEEFAAGGHGIKVACANAVVRQIVQVLALWITNRAEHELILQWNPHDCFHCEYASEDRDCPAHFSSDYANLHDLAIVDEQVQEAMVESTYWRDMHNVNITCHTLPDQALCICACHAVYLISKFLNLSVVLGAVATRGRMHTPPRTPHLSQLCSFQTPSSMLTVARVPVSSLCNDTSTVKDTCIASQSPVGFAHCPTAI